MGSEMCIRDRLKLAGVGTDLEVETPTTVATIRGTAFGVVVRGNSTDVVVAEGKINTRSYQVKEGVKEFLADQNVRFCRKTAQKGYIIEKGAIRYQDDMEKILENKEIVKKYLAV